mgnify:FL=1
MFFMTFVVATRNVWMFSLKSKDETWFAGCSRDVELSESEALILDNVGIQFELTDPYSTVQNSIAVSILAALTL